MNLRLVLKRHPDSACDAVTSIEVEVAHPRPGNLLLHYFVSGRITDLRLPPVAPPVRADELWRHTCFEAFVRPSPDTAYYEFNFAPSTQWAAYRFAGYRSAMRSADEVGAPRIEIRSNGACFELEAALALPDLCDAVSCQLGLSAVIEEASGRISYWALAHPPGRADFHHADCFAQEIPAASRP